MAYQFTPDGRLIDTATGQPVDQVPIYNNTQPQPNANANGAIPWDRLIAAMGGQQQDFSHLLHPPDVQGDYNRKMGLPGAAWDAGLFGAKPGTPEFSGRTTTFDPAAAAATSRQVSGVPGMLPVTPPMGRQVADPFDTNGAPLPGVDFSSLVGPSSQPAPAPMGPTRNIPGGVEGMINPGLPNDKKYQDANFWTALMGAPKTARRPAY